MIFHRHKTCCKPSMVTVTCSDVGQDVAGREAHRDQTRELAALPVSFVTQVKGVKLLQVGQVAAQGRLTHERVLQNVLVVDLIDKEVRETDADYRRKQNRIHS